jgi:hypothetical protein
METLYRYVDPKTGAKVRLIARKPVTNMSVANDFIVALDVPGKYAAFDNFPNITEAADAFATLVEKYAGNVETVSLETAL